MPTLEKRQFRSERKVSFFRRICLTNRHCVSVHSFLSGRDTSRCNRFSAHQTRLNDGCMPDAQMTVYRSLTAGENLSRFMFPCVFLQGDDRFGSGTAAFCGQAGAFPEFPGFRSTGEPQRGRISLFHVQGAC